MLIYFFKLNSPSKSTKKLNSQWSDGEQLWCDDYVSIKWL